MEDDEIPVMKGGFGDAVGFGLRKLEGRFGALERRIRSPLQEAEDKLNQLISTQKYVSFNDREKIAVKNTLMKVPNIFYLDSETSLTAGLFIIRYNSNLTKGQNTILTPSNIKAFKRIISFDSIGIIRYTLYLEKYFK